MFEVAEEEGVSVGGQVMEDEEETSPEVERGVGDSLVETEGNKEDVEGDPLTCLEQETSQGFYLTLRTLGLVQTSSFFWCFFRRRTVIFDSRLEKYSSISPELLRKFLLEIKFIST